MCEFMRQQASSGRRARLVPTGCKGDVRSDGEGVGRQPARVGGCRCVGMNPYATEVHAESPFEERAIGGVQFLAAGSSLAARPERWQSRRICGRQRGGGGGGG